MSVIARNEPVDPDEASHLLSRLTPREAVELLVLERDRERDEIGRLCEQLAGAVSAIEQAHKALSGRDVTQADVDRAYDVLDARLTTDPGGQ